MGEAAQKKEGVDALPSTAIDTAVLYVSRTNLRPIVRQELKNLNIHNVLNAESVEHCIEQLVLNPEALLALDWEHGKEEVNAVLRAAQGAFNVDTRPIFLMSAEVDSEVVAVATEYNVARVQSGEISRSVLAEHIQLICDYEANLDGLKGEMIKVADARQRGDWALAGQVLSQLHDQYGSNRRVICELAENLIQEDRWQEAIGILEDLAQMDDVHLRARHLYARCLMKKAEFTQASEVLRSCQLINPYNVDRLIDLGEALLQQRKVDEAMEQFNMARSLDDRREDALKGQSKCLLLEGELNQALALLKEVSGPQELASVFNNAAVLCIRQTQFEQGINLYRSAIGVTQENNKVVARLYFNLGLAFHKSDRLSEAFDCFRQAHRADPAFEKAEHNMKILERLLSVTDGDDITDELSDGFNEDFEDEHL